MPNYKDFDLDVQKSRISLYPEKDDNRTEVNTSQTVTQYCITIDYTSNCWTRKRGSCYDMHTMCGY